MGKRKSNNEYIESISSNATNAFKVKKKSKWNKSDSSFEMEESSINDNGQALESIKNKKKSKKFEEDRPIQRNEIDWSLEESKKLLEMISSVTKSRGDHSYKADLAKLDFSIVAEKMNNRTSDECRTQFELLIKKVNKVKTMQCLINDTLIYISKRKTESGSGYMKFMKDNLDKINQEMIARGLESNQRFQLTSALWNDLDEEAKQKYKLQGLIQQDSDKVSTYPSAFDMYQSKLRKKGSMLSHQEIRAQYKALEVSKRIKYIEKSIKIINETVLNQISLFKKEHPDEEPPTMPKFPIPNKEETKYYLLHIGMPEMPPKLPAVFFFKESKLLAKDVSKLLIEASACFRNLSTKEKHYWNKRYKQAWKNYEEEMSIWMDKQNDIVKELVKWIAPPKSSVVKQEIPTIQFKTVEMPISSSMHLPNEPDLNCPLTALKVFADVLEKNGKGVNFANLKLQFKELPQEKKEEYQSTADDIKKSLVLHLKTYVDNLAIEQRRLYLGLRRKKIMDLLKEDIFSDYGDEEYPLFVKKSIKSEVEDPEKSHISSQNNMGKSKLPKNKIKRKLLVKDEEMLDLSPENHMQKITANSSSSDEETDAEEKPSSRATHKSKSIKTTSNSGSSESDEESSYPKSALKTKKNSANSDIAGELISSKKNTKKSLKSLTPAAKSSSRESYEESSNPKSPRKTKKLPISSGLLEEQISSLKSPKKSLKSLTPATKSSSSKSYEESSNPKSEQKTKKLPISSGLLNVQISSPKSPKKSLKHIPAPRSASSESSSDEEQNSKLKTPRKENAVRTPVNKHSSSSESDTDENENSKLKTPQISKSTNSAQKMTHNKLPSESSSSDEESSSEEDLDEAWHNTSASSKKSRKEKSESEED